jgi:sulfoxide reductase heme-binding subunit YedZ
MTTLTRAQTINQTLRRVPTWPIYLLGAGWIGWQFWLALSGQGKYGVEPINVLEREYGLRALQLLVLGLAITPVLRWTRVNLIRFRRAIGVTTFVFVLAHFAVWAILDLGLRLDQVWTEIVKRPYITVGMLAFVGLIPLALTSNNWSVRRLGRKWMTLHKLTYGIVVLAGLHFLWLVKGFQIEPILYMAGILGLLALRVRWQKRRAAAAA